MKNIFFFVGIMIFLGNGTSFAQFEGKKYVSGSFGLSFGNSNPVSGQAGQRYEYNLGFSLGKFKTETRASGWNLNSSLSGTENSTLQFDGSNFVESSGKGLNYFKIGAGRFWHFYKHINDKTGLFGGPEINANYSLNKEYGNIGSSLLSVNTTKTIQLSMGLTAGVYYRFSDKWWGTASLAFSDPVSVGYSFLKQLKSLDPNTIETTKNVQLGYRLSPSFSFPSVGLGFRYFL
ncbi:hypothetical protein [Dyadobacter psychrotolerans]|uniref:Outer membrane protein beta-barrel domain-containing protein n=1 Tax=Dyadobacter psychrotolerans TaxID=2541721 RepID=A0A4R5E2R6_9BACT|nr:hypothetical protein [Dyadobacter psychrotolerans]TDE18503.1 hypothetical protein E0F88_02905 [Dyadobacter psychrotolerans]